MARNKTPGDKMRVGAAKPRSQIENPITGTWVKREHQSKPKHRDRAVQAIAEHICASDYTDGFCSPRDGGCRQGQVCGYRNCMRTAEHCMRAMESRGVMVVWPYDKE